MNLIVYILGFLVGTSFGSDAIITLFDQPGCASTANTFDFTPAASDYGDAIHHCVQGLPALTKSLRVMQIARGCSGEPSSVDGEEDTVEFGTLIRFCSDCIFQYLL